MISYKIRIDMQEERESCENIVFTSGDARGYKLDFEFYSYGKKLDVSGYALTVKAKRADGAVIIDSGTTGESGASYIVADNAYNVKGEVSFEVALVRADGSYATTHVILAQVREGFGESGLLEADNEPVLAKLEAQYLENRALSQANSKAVAERMPLYIHNTALDFNSDEAKVNGIHLINASPVNAPCGNWGALFSFADAGTPFQLYIPDSGSVFYKRQSASASWLSYDWTSLYNNVLNLNKQANTNAEAISANSEAIGNLEEDIAVVGKQADTNASDIRSVMTQVDGNTNNINSNTVLIYETDSRINDVESRIDNNAEAISNADIRIDSVVETISNLEQTVDENNTHSNSRIDNVESVVSELLPVISSYSRIGYYDGWVSKNSDYNGSRIFKAKYPIFGLSSENSEALCFMREYIDGNTQTAEQSVLVISYNGEVEHWVRALELSLAGNPDEEVGGSGFVVDAAGEFYPQETGSFEEMYGESTLFTKLIQVDANTAAIGDINTALDELHEYAQALAGGGDN